MRAPHTTIHRIVPLAACALLCACEPAAEIDHYVLALSWQPAFCERNADKPECRELDGGDFAATHLVLHGLWPNAADGEHPYYCGVSFSDRRTDDAGDWCALPQTGADQDTQFDLKRLMPGAKSCLDRHEWIKHGTCSGLDGDAYFDASVRLVQEIQTTQLSELLRGNIGEQVFIRDLIQAFEQDFGADAAAALRITCRRGDGGTYLAEIRLALRPEAIGKPSEAIDELLSRNALFLDGPVPKGDCPAEIIIDRAG